MQLIFIFIMGLAAIVASLPTSTLDARAPLAYCPPGGGTLDMQADTAEKPGKKVGEVWMFSTTHFDRWVQLGDLRVNGAYVNFPDGAQFGHWATGYRCRFYEKKNCDHQIGGDVGLPGGKLQRMDIPALSATCWWDPTLLAGEEFEPDDLPANDTSIPSTATTVLASDVEPNDLINFTSPRSTTRTAVKPAKKIGEVYGIGQRMIKVGDLTVNGAYCNFNAPTDYGGWAAGYRCRFYEDKNGQRQIGGKVGLPGDADGYKSIDRPALSATCWWDPKTTVDEGDIAPRALASEAVTSNTTLSTGFSPASTSAPPRGAFIGNMYWDSAIPSQEKGSLYANGGCVNFQIANVGWWNPGYRCRFYVSAGCHDADQIGGRAGLDGSWNLANKLNHWACSATCWYTHPARAAANLGDGILSVAAPRAVAPKALAPTAVTPRDVTCTPLTEISTRDIPVGIVYWDDFHHEVGDLTMNGGCGNFKAIANKGAWCDGYRCRFYESKDCKNQIGGNSGAISNGEMRSIDKNAWSATCWWDPRVVAVASRTEIRDITIGKVFWRFLNQISGNLVVNGGCIDFNGVANKGKWSDGYRCRFYETKGCKAQIGGDAGLASHDRLIAFDKETWSATCWWDPNALATRDVTPKVDVLGAEPSDLASSTTSHSTDIAPLSPSLSPSTLGIAKQPIRIGRAYYDDVKRSVGDLYVNGGCVNFIGYQATKAEYLAGFRCRFYEWKNCNGQIGGDVGLPGRNTGLLSGSLLSIDEPYARSATCWWDRK